MEILIDISNSKLSANLTRKARMYAFRWNADQKFLAIDIYVTHYNNGYLVQTQGTNTFSITFVADNATLVDPATGQYLPKDEAENYTDEQKESGMGEYDFFYLLAESGPVDIIALIKQHMSLADQLGRYDV